MSRSRKNYIVFSYSDNPWHVLDNRRYRHACKIATRKAIEDWDSFLLPKMREISSPYNWPSDGGNHISLPHCCTFACDFYERDAWRCAWKRKVERQALRK